MDPILIACEESQEVCKAFRNLGYEAFSCDVLPCSGGRPDWHIKGYLEDIIGDGSNWAAIIGFPPCTYLCSSGIHWNSKDPERALKTEYALSFVEMILNSPKTKAIALENPIGVISTRIRKPNQIIQPYQFGHDASKATCLWLKNLPLLKPTGFIEPRIVQGKKRWANQTDSGQNRLPPSVDRAMIRSKTYKGIAEAMAEQWGPVIELL